MKNILLPVAVLLFAGNIFANEGQYLGQPITREYRETQLPAAFQGEQRITREMQVKDRPLSEAFQGEQRITREMQVKDRPLSEAFQGEQRLGQSVTREMVVR